MKAILVSLVALFSFSAFAYDPVPFDKLSPQSLDVISVLGSNPKQFLELMSYGNRVTEAAYQNLAPDYSRYKITVQHCETATGCIGGAVLYVRKMKDPRSTGNGAWNYDFKITRLK